MRYEGEASDQKRAAEGSAGAADRTLSVNTRSGSCAGGPERETNLDVTRNNVAPDPWECVSLDGSRAATRHGVARSWCPPSFRERGRSPRGLTKWSSAASVASPLQRRVRPTSRPRGRCGAQRWGEAGQSGSEGFCCSGGPESGLGLEERRGVSGAPGGGLRPARPWRESRGVRGLGQPMGCSGSTATRHSRALPDAGRALAGRW